MEPLEIRRLFAGLGDAAPLPPPMAASLSPVLSPGLQATWNVSFIDPAATWSAYYNDITRMIQAAGREWDRMFDSTASIEVSVSFSTAIATATARSATSSLVYFDATNSIYVYEQGVAAEINTGLDPNGASPDLEMTIGVNPANNFLSGKLWFDPDPAARIDIIPAGKVDAFSVMAHELGHAIAYNGWADWTTGQTPGSYASTFDEYILNNAGHNYFTGSFANEVYGGDPALTDGSVYHWGNLAGPGDNLVTQLMNGVAFVEQSRYDLSILDVAVMNDVGMLLETNPPMLTQGIYDFNLTGRIQLTFDESVRLSLQSSDLTLNRLGPGGLTTIALDPGQLSYLRKFDRAEIAASLPDGNYSLSLSADAISDLAGNLLTPTPSVNFYVLGADANRDRHVDTRDFNLLAANFGGTSKTFSSGNFDYDAAGSVNSIDFDLLIAQYGKVLQATSAAIASVGSPFAVRTVPVSGALALLEQP